MTDLIYTPRGRAGEYADLALNHYRGCGHGCVYCYAPQVLRMKRDEFHYCPRERSADFLDRLQKEAAKKHANGITGRVLLSFTTDPYQPLDRDIGLTRQVICVLHSHGFNVAILTKGGDRACRDLDILRPGDAYAATLTWDIPDEARSKAWEPAAATPHNRMAALRVFHNAGLDTWVSLEPVLSPQAALAIIRRTAEYVDHYKVGKLNYANRLPEYFRSQVSGIDWTQFAQQVVDLLDKLGKSYYIKDDLRHYLTRGVLAEAQQLRLLGTA